MYLPMEDNLDMPLRDVLQIMQRNMMNQSTYFGIQAWKCPTDFWMYQEIIFETRPDVILEIGCNRGGGSLALTHLCQNLGHGRVIGLDITLDKVSPRLKQQAGLTFIEGDAADSFERVRQMIDEEESVLVIEDSAHTYENTLAVLRQYSALLKVGDYIIVEDSIMDHGLTIPDSPEVGPYEAVECFLAENDAFALNRGKERFMITWNPKGYLQRVK